MGDDIYAGSFTCIASGRGGDVYLLTGNAHVWKSTDWGFPLGQFSNMPRYAGYQFIYGICVLETGTVLVSNTNPAGGHIYRSENGGIDWHDLGAMSSMALYRFEKLPGAVLVNGWAGHVYKSIDDGRTWTDMGQVSKKALYATEYLENGITLQGSEDGRIFRSRDYGVTWSEIAKFAEAADDFIYLGGGVVIYATYTGERSVYRSADFGLTWKNVGPVPTGIADDSIDHAVRVKCKGRVIGVGGTMRGNIVVYR